MPRSDNDSWDLATGVGATATMVAAAGAVAPQADGALIDDPFAGPLVRTVGIDLFARWVDGDIDAADVDAPEDAWGLQRMADLMSARTRYFDEFFRDATAAGIRQAVVRASAPGPTVVLARRDNGFRGRPAAGHRVRIAAAGRPLRRGSMNCRPPMDCRRFPKHRPTRHFWTTTTARRPGATSSSAHGRSGAGGAGSPASPGMCSSTRAR